MAVADGYDVDRALLVGAAPPPGEQEQTSLVLLPMNDALPRIVWLGPAGPGLNAADVADIRQRGAARPGNQGGEAHSVPLLGEVATLWFGRPGLAGHRLGGPTSAGRDWATAFVTDRIEVEASRTTVHASDHRAALRLATDIETLVGGALRIRHTVTNDGDDPYVLEHLEVAVPVDERAVEVLDLTGRWGRERSPQRHRLTDGTHLREGRTGRPNFDSPTLLVVGTEGFGFNTGLVWGLHVAWSGNSRYFAEQQPHGLLTIGGGELLLPGELVLGKGESYSTPPVIVVASAHGLDGLSAQLHRYVRSLPAHPSEPRPVMGNVWEAVYFDHDLDRLERLADLSAQVGIERFVLDDGWFGARRDDTAGLGDWVVSPDVWPDGLGPIVDHVHAAGMTFGLWFEPEMVNRDSDLYRAHPDWVLAVGDRPPLESRNQLVLDLGRAEVRRYLFEQLHAVLSEYPIDFVKWDHNRPLADAGSGARAGAPGVHAQTVGFYALLDELRAAHPAVEWESCASGGGRIDLGVIERVQRFWTSDMTDALSRQLIQRWTGLLVPPEYLGAHVSAPRNHQTGRQLSLDFRAATAFFASMGVEWDVSAADENDRARLAGWIAAHRRHRDLLHSGRVLRVDSACQDVLIHGVLSADRREAVLAYVQLDETVHEPVPFIVPGLLAETRYRARQIMPPMDGPSAEGADGADEPGPRGGLGWPGTGRSFSGGVLAQLGLPTPSRAPESATLVHLLAE